MSSWRYCAEKISIKFFLSSIFLFAPIFAYAQVSFSEVMYDPKGSDAGNEWVELVNSGSGSVDLTDWKLVENETNHKISSFQGGIVLKGSEHGVIVDNPEKFLAGHAGYTGRIFDSSFSLSNTGETLVLKSADSVVVDTLTYDSTQGGAGDGNSLQKISGVWRSAAPTLGSSPASTQEVVSNTTTYPTQTVTDISPASGKGMGGGFPVDPQIFADAGDETRTVLVGAPVTFSGKVIGLKKEPIENARMLWTFGDGAYKDGVSVSHVFYYPGEYTVVLNATSGYFSASDRVHVSVLVPNFSLFVGGEAGHSFIVVENKNTEEINISDWQLFANGKVFVFPQNSVLSGHKAIKFASEVTGLDTPIGSSIELRFSNGSKVPIASSPQSASSTLLGIGEEVPVAVNGSTEKPSVTHRNISQVASVTGMHQDFQPSAEPTEGHVQKLESSEKLFWWYCGIMAMCLTVFIFLRYSRRSELVPERVQKDGSFDGDKPTADEFEIIEEK